MGIFDQMKQAMQMRNEAKRIQAEIEKISVEYANGGISVTAHRKGRMIDGNDAGGGEGPFTPTRMGSMAVTDIVFPVSVVHGTE